MNSESDADHLAVGRFLIHYRRSGAGPPLILLHGGGSWRYTFRRNIGPLSRHFSVFAPDIPGHGYTRPLGPVRSYDTRTAIRAIVGFMDGIGISKAHLLGHSWGGGWAIHFTGAFPERVNRLVLIGASGLNRYERPAWEILKWPVVGKLLTRMVNRRTVRKGLETAFSNRKNVTPEMIDAVHAPLTFRHVQDAQHLYARNLDWSRTPSILRHLRNPALVIWGKEDRYINVAHGRRMAGLLPDARLVILEGCGHLPHEEQPGTVNDCVRRFLLEGVE